MTDGSRSLVVEGSGNVAVSAGGFQPWQIPGLSIWLDPSVGVTLDGGSTRVTQWDSRMQMPVSFTQPVTSSMPILVSVGGRQFLSFGGTNEITGGNMTHPAQYTWFATYRVDALVNAAIHRIIGNRNLAAAQASFELRADGTSGAMQFGTVSNTGTNSQINFGSAVVGATKGLVAQRTATGQRATQTPTTIGAETTLSGVTQNTPTSSLPIGQSFQGLIGHILRYDRALSDSEIAQVRSWLQTVGGTD